MSIYTNNSISADDPEAIAKLTAKLDKLEQTQARMKSVNAYFRKNGTLDGCPDLPAAAIEKLKAEMSNGWHGDKPFPTWALSNGSAEIRRVKSRIETLTRQKEQGYKGWTFDGGTVEANAEDNRLQIFFDEKPDADLRTELKRNGFKWAPSVGAWQRQLNDRAIYAADYIKAIQPISGGRPSELQRKRDPA